MSTTHFGQYSDAENLYNAPLTLQGALPNLNKITPDVMFVSWVECKNV